MKKGFTLVEVLGVFVILGILGLIVFPTVTSMLKKSKEELYTAQVKEIKEAANKWAHKNINILPSEENESVTITLYDLKRGGYLPLDIRDPRTNELLSNGLSILITYKNNDYEFNIRNVVSNTEYSENSPTIVINGESIEYVEINTDFLEKSAIARDKNGQVLNNMLTTYYDNGREISRIDTSRLKSYTTNYSVTDNNYITVVTRTVIVRDTTKPVITLPDTSIEITHSQASTFDILEGVSAIDNSLENLTIQTTGFDTSIGEKVVTYKACDSSENCESVNRLIKIVE